MSLTRSRRAPSVGEQTCDVLTVNNNLTLTSGTVWFGCFEARRTESIGGIIVPTTGTAAAATPTLVRFGIYTISAAGALTLVASTPNDTTLLASTFNEVASGPRKALSVALAKVAGQQYAVGILVVTAVAAPTIGACVTVASPFFAPNNSRPRAAGKLAGQTDLPASVAAGSVAASNSIPYALLVA